MPSVITFWENFTWWSDHISPYQLYNNARSQTTNVLSNTNTQKKAISFLEKYNTLKLALEKVKNFKEILSPSSWIWINSIWSSILWNKWNLLFNAGILWRYDDILSKYKIENTNLWSIFFDDILNILILDYGKDVVANRFTKKIENKTIWAAAEIWIQALSKTHEKIVKSVENSLVYIEEILKEYGIDWWYLRDPYITAGQIKSGQKKVKDLPKDYEYNKQKTLQPEDAENINQIIFWKNK